MPVEIIASVVYILILVVHGMVTAYNGITVRNGSFWVLLLCLCGAFACGRIIGGVVD